MAMKITITMAMTMTMESVKRLMWIILNTFMKSTLRMINDDHRYSILLYLDQLINLDGDDD